MPVDTPYRLELATDIRDYIRILKADGARTPEVRRSLMQGFHPTTKKAKQRKIRKALQ